MKFAWVVLLVFAVIVMGAMMALGVVGSWSAQADAYYRGVYETCVRSYVMDGNYTLFDVQVCQDFEQRARSEKWYEKALVKP